MRHPRAQQCVILAAYLAVCAASKADGWTTNAWPSQQYPRQGKMQLSDVWSSTVERCQVVGISNPVAPAWYRFQRTTVTNIKSRMKVLIPYFVNASVLATGTPAASSYFSNNSGASASFPMYSVASLLAECKLPTNYLDYTPWRSLIGLGGATNDASAVYPHGETNATTAAGGTNFPAGRSVWYSTDYSWAGWTSIVARLKWTYGGEAGFSETNKWHSGAECHANSAASLDATITAAYASDWGAYQPTDFGTLMWRGVNDWQGGKKQGQFYASLSGLSTSVNKFVEWYAYSSPLHRYLIDQVYTNWGTPLENNIFAYVGQSAVTNGAVADLPVWGVHGSNMPPSSSPVGTYMIGFRMGTGKTLIRWDVTGGFTYR
jgi:hypothetical protein